MEGEEIEVKEITREECLTLSPGRGGREKVLEVKVERGS